MNLIEAKKEVKLLENQYNYWLNEKENLKSLVLPKGIQITPDKVNGGKREDRMLTYIELLDDKKIDETLEYITRRKRNLEHFIEEELKILGEYNTLEKKIYDLRYDEVYIKENGKERTFYEIGNIVGYSKGQCYKILQKMLNKRNV